MKKPEKVLDHRGDDRQRSKSLINAAHTVVNGSSSTASLSNRRSAADSPTSECSSSTPRECEEFRAVDRPRTDQAYASVRDAARQRQRVTPAFKQAMDAAPVWVRAAIRRYCAALRDEAAAYRVEAKAHRLRLEEITREHHTQDQDTSEVLP